MKQGGREERRMTDNDDEDDDDDDDDNAMLCATKAKAKVRNDKLETNADGNRDGGGDVNAATTQHDMTNSYTHRHKPHAHTNRQTHTHKHTESNATAATIKTNEIN